MKKIGTLISLAILIALFDLSPARAQSALPKGCDIPSTLYDHAHGPRNEEVEGQFIECIKKVVADPACRTPESADIIKYLDARIAKLPAIFEAERLNALYDAFNRAVVAKNWVEAFAKGNEIIALPKSRVDPPPAPMQDVCDEIYEKFKSRYNSNTVEDKAEALALAKRYLGNPVCKTSETADIVKYLEEKVKDLERPIFGDTFGGPEIAIFNQSVPNKKWRDAFSSGQKIIENRPQYTLDISLVLAAFGFEQQSCKPPPAAEPPAVVPRVNKRRRVPDIPPRRKDALVVAYFWQDLCRPQFTYGDDTIAMAKQAIAHIDDKSDRYGFFDRYEYETAEFPDGKSNALGWMNFIVGYITAQQTGDLREAVPYLYKASQYKSGAANRPEIYRFIGEWYLDRFNRASGNITNEFDDAETAAILAAQRGFADRALDAYLRAYRTVPESETESKYKTAIYRRMKEISLLMFDKPDDFDIYVKNTVTGSFPDPMGDVKPIPGKR